MKIYIDTEFNEKDGELLSIAMVKRDGKQNWLGRHKTKKDAQEAVTNFIENFCT